jgi:hypothetical protein
MRQHASSLNAVPRALPVDARSFAYYDVTARNRAISHFKLA